MMNPAFFSSAVRRGVRSLLLGATGLCAGLHGVNAQGAAPVARESGKEYVLAKSSSFKAPPGDTRNPFWPIGWTPGPVVAPTQAAVVSTVKPEDFVLTTTSLDVPPLAIINGRSYTLRETVPVAPGSSEVVTVKSIQDGLVVLDHRGHELRITPSTGARPKK